VCVFVQGYGNALSTQGIFGSLNETYSTNDLKTFQTFFKLGQQVATAPYGNGNGNSVCPRFPDQCMEAMLDLEYMMAMSSAVSTCATCTTNCGSCGATSKVSPTMYWYMDDVRAALVSRHDLFVYWLIQVTNTTQIPWVLSVSYGGPEHYIATSELDTFNSMMIKLGAMGVTVLVASGDNGAPNDDAIGNAGACGYWPDFPGANPYVLSVGATQGLEQSYKRERACQSDTNGMITTGGGFSNHYPRPSWQTKAVTNYLRLRAPPTMAPTTAANKNLGTNFNSGGRGYQDLSAAGFQYITIVGGSVQFVAGTSASAPVVAGMISLVNAARLARGYPTVGFVNPALYANNFTIGFNDVLDGKNNCVMADSDGNTVCCSQGFTGAPGWDPVTGMSVVGCVYFSLSLLSHPSFSCTAKHQQPQGSVRSISPRF
jgi:tripeptidyl-peptidase-1